MGEAPVLQLAPGVRRPNPGARAACLCAGILLATAISCAQGVQVQEQPRSISPAAVDSARAVVRALVARERLPGMAVTVTGAAYAYSSYGYNLLGVVLEEATGRPFAELLSRSVLAPLGMSAIGVPKRTAASPRIVCDKRLERLTRREPGIPSRGRHPLFENAARPLIGASGAKRPRSDLPDIPPLHSPSGNGYHASMASRLRILLIGTAVLLLQGAPLTVVAAVSRHTCGPNQRGVIEVQATAGHAEHSTHAAARFHAVAAPVGGGAVWSNGQQCSHCAHPECATSQHCAASAAVALSSHGAAQISPATDIARCTWVPHRPLSINRAPPIPPPQTVL